MSTFEKIRKAALARLDAGESLEIILQDYADYEDDLRPILAKATGKPIKNRTYPTTKTKNKNDEKSASFMPLMLGVSAVLLLFIVFGAVVLIPTSEGIFDPAPDNIFVPASENDCIGIPQAQITSGFALQNQNEQQTTNDSRSSTVETTSELVLSAPVDTSASGGMDSVAIASTSVPLGTMSATSDMDMADEPMMEEAESDDGVSTDYYDEESASDSVVAPVAPAPEVSRSTANVSTDPLRAGAGRSGRAGGGHQPRHQDADSARSCRD